MKLCIALLVLCCVALQWSDAIRWRRHMWHMPVHYPGIRNGWIRRIFPGAVGKIVRLVKGRDVETDATQDDFQDVDDAELENILSERDVLDIMKALDDDGDDSISVDDVSDKQ